LLARLLRHLREAKGAAHAITPPAPAVVQRFGERPRRTSALVWRVLAQTRARVLRDTHHPDKVVSLSPSGVIANNLNVRPSRPAVGTTNA
jgi:hypothetical protein